MSDTNNELPAPPTTAEMLNYIQGVTPILKDIEGAKALANEYAARLQERGIDYRTGLTISSPKESPMAPDLEVKDSPSEAPSDKTTE